MRMHQRVFGLAAAIALALELCDATLHLSVLPLGGGFLQQMGVVFGAAFILCEVAEKLRRPKRMGKQK
jgi:hypothetical protein